MNKINSFIALTTFILWCVFIFNPDTTLRYFISLGIGYVCGEVFYRGFKD